MIATIVLLLFIGAISFAYFKNLNAIDKFRKNIHQGHVVTCRLGQNIFTAIVAKIPAEDRVIIKDLDHEDYHIVSINTIYPL